MCMHILPVYMYVHRVCAWSPRGQERLLDSLDQIVNLREGWGWEVRGGGWGGVAGN